MGTSVKSKILFSITLDNGNKIEKWAYSKAQFKTLVYRLYGISVYDNLISIISEQKKFYVIQAKSKSKIFADAYANELALLSGHKDQD